MNAPVYINRRIRRSRMSPHRKRMLIAAAVSFGLAGGLLALAAGIL